MWCFFHYLWLYIISDIDVQSTKIITKMQTKSKTKAWRLNFLKILDKIWQILTKNAIFHEITASHQSLSDAISCVTDKIRFLLDTVTGRFSNFNSISYAEDRHKLRVTGTKCQHGVRHWQNIYFRCCIFYKNVIYSKLHFVSWLELETWNLGFVCRKKLQKIYRKRKCEFLIFSLFIVS